MPNTPNSLYFISAVAQGPELIKYSELGVLGIIRKPFDPIAISKTIYVLYQSSQKNLDDVEYIMI